MFKRLPTIISKLTVSQDFFNLDSSPYLYMYSLSLTHTHIYIHIHIYLNLFPKSKQKCITPL